ncbi:MAG: Nuclease-related domain protein [Syntrophorhabdus sp. PtaU1.Bin153]|nr:MAG: Nuclease-related domain protein [Syntrophorhabdus sp. PtaU1.Bin153]
MREVFLSDHLKKEARKNLAICLGAVGFGSALLVTGAVTGIMLPVVLGGVALVSSGFIVTKRGRMYVTYRCGMRGEYVLRNRLRSLGLSDEHTAYYNLPVNGNAKVSDIDCVLVGPSGLFVFEVKHHRGLIFHRNGIWAQIKAGRRGSPYAGHLGDPSAQLSRNIRYLKARLERADLKTPWIQGAIVFTNPQAVLDIDGFRRIKAITAKNLRQIISARRTLSSEQAHGINACLSMSEK